MIPDPEAMTPDAGTVIPDPIYLVTTLDSYSGSYSDSDSGSDGESGSHRVTAMLIHGNGNA